MKSTERNRTLLLAGVLGWLAVMLITRERAEFAGATLAYYGGFGLFLGGFLLINLSDRVTANHRLSLLLMLVQVCGFFAVFITCQSTDALILLVIFAGQLPFFVNRHQAIITLLAINGIAFLLYHVGWNQGLSPSLIAIALNLAFQCFSLTVADIAVRESKARLALEQANAELMSTRALLEQASRQSERLKLSRDLHDICGHQLTALLLNLEFLSQTVPAEKQSDVNETKAIAKDLLEQIRSVVRENKQSAQLDLNAAIDSLFSHLPQVSARFERRLSGPLQSSHHAEVLLRICQEAVSNALRHGNGKDLIIALEQDEESLTMTVSNSFSGSPAASDGSGLANMRERAAQLDGAVTLTSDHQIWTVTVSLPYKEQQYD
ncbi:sensor histidine kinase [Alteromonas lipolytica]|uniref:Uncharacterized protein n=1 Tax=Alteromonas lipolytica TaxID=1856405 RepID=A0A1E8FI52_9ALTE|nr:histidine kinase [Alteromonas lipolytica]OFI35615.1 hypothetical protein BFC17_12730 [Alteromonas lipolytica]GGF77611.1 hypothetical protein GCM10011338_32480 [Alteromonas lipolytica]